MKNKEIEIIEEKVLYLSELPYEIDEDRLSDKKVLIVKKSNKFYVSSVDLNYKIKDDFFINSVSFTKLKEARDLFDYYCKQLSSINIMTIHHINDKFDWNGKFKF